MSAGRDYPLRVLLELREAERDEAKAHLAAAQRSFAASEQATKEARAQLDAHREANEQLLATFAAARGAVSPGELRRRDAYRRRRKDEARALADALSAAEANERDASRAVEAAQAVLAQARAHLAAVEKDAECHRAEAATRAEAREESELEDRLKARRRG